MAFIHLLVAVVLASFFSTSLALAGKTVEYKAGATVLEGYLAFPKKVSAKNPAVIIVHDWMGLGSSMQEKADQMAAMGYIALAADIYGKGVRPTNQKEAALFAGKYKNDLKLLRERITSARDFLLTQKGVHPEKLVAFGYCFGGTVALELGRTGAPVAGLVSFHGGLATPNPAEASNIKGKVLILHGAIDPFVSDKELADFKKSMDQANIDYQFISYSGAVHSFTNPKAGSDIKAGAAYNEMADRRSWRAFKDFLSEVAPL